MRSDAGSFEVNRSLIKALSAPKTAIKLAPLQHPLQEDAKSIPRQNGGDDGALGPAANVPES